MTNTRKIAATAMTAALMAGGAGLLAAQPANADCGPYLAEQCGPSAQVVDLKAQLRHARHVEAHLERRVERLTIRNLRLRHRLTGHPVTAITARPH